MNNQTNNDDNIEYDHKYLVRKRRFVATSKAKENTIEFKLIQAIYQNDPDTFDRLIDKLDTIDSPIGTGKSKWTPLMFSVHKRRWKFVIKLLQKGANANCIDRSTKKTCLHLVCTGGYARIARYLLETKKIIDINNNATNDGESPLYCAVKKGRIKCVELLLDRSLHGQVCDINLKTHGHSPLLIACDKGDADMVKLLLDYEFMECDLNSQDNKGYTPLMKAVGKGHEKVVEMLLDKGDKLDLDLMNDGLNQCAAVIAVRANNFKIAKMILDRGFDGDVLYRKDWKDRTVLDQCARFRVPKEITNYVKQLLHRKVHGVIQSINSSEMHQDVPYLPIGVVQSICNMTY